MRTSAIIREAITDYFALLMWVIRKLRNREAK